jgi:hypothetical protein
VLAFEKAKAAPVVTAEVRAKPKSYAEIKAEIAAEQAALRIAADNARVDAELAAEEAAAKSKPTPFCPDPQPEAVTQPAEEPDCSAVPKPGTALQLASNDLLVVEPLALPEAIKTMNDKHAVISNLGDKCVVMEWVPSVIMPEAKELSYQSFTSLRERYANKFVDLGGPAGRMSQATYWLTHPQRRQYEGLELAPNGPSVLPGGYLNLWRGWGVEPRKGSWRLISGTSPRCWPTAIKSLRTMSRDGPLGSSRTQACRLRWP